MYLQELLTKHEDSGECKLTIVEEPICDQKTKHNFASLIKQSVKYLLIIENFHTFFEHLFLSEGKD